MYISNPALDWREADLLVWLTWDHTTPVTDGIIRQINNAEVIRGGASLRFLVDRDVPRVDVPQGAVAELVTRLDGEGPKHYRLLVADGCVHELECLSIPDSGGLVTNPALSELERLWLETLLLKDFPARSAVLRQINSAEIYRDYNLGYLSLRFRVDASVPRVDVPQRVPIEMSAENRGVRHESGRDDEPLLDFLLHFIDGYVDELEIYDAAGNGISPEIPLDVMNVYVRYDPGLSHV